MKIFTKNQIYQGDKLTIERQNITSVDLMERAGIAVFNWIDLRLQGEPVAIHVFCGTGNNGGDGLVIARHLIINGYNVSTYIVNHTSKRSKDFLANYERIKKATKKWPILLNSKADFPEIEKDDVIVDAVFGIGLNRPVDDWVKALFINFNTSEAFTLSVDMPSGLYIDKPVIDEDAVVWADYTLSFTTPKFVFFLPEVSKYVMSWEALDINLDETFLLETETDVNLIGKYEILLLYKPRNKFSHKGTFGHALIIGGSYGKIGAAILASKAALSAGAGLVSSYIPKCGYIPMQCSFPEAMVITDANEEKITDIKFDINPTVIGLGVGIGTDLKTIKAFEAFLKTNKTPLVIDADGINVLAKHKELLKLLPSETVLTPHPKELERLVGKWTDDFNKLEKVKKFSKKHNAIVVIKGANTITVYHDKLYVNTTGNPGLATAGSGDVLTGIITGLIAQGYDSLIAAVFGVYLHGKSADIAVGEYGHESLIASHVIEYLGQAYMDLFEEPEALEDEGDDGDDE